jgi:nitroimidazol reductase NimA-like FMN-containing flavoprotein (pyridoxamine 5'-phosphate oxidase superfamily)
MTMTPEQDSYLREQKMAVLATGRKDGSPQISTINYAFDGTDIAISVTSDRAKWVNAVRQPRVSMLVLDGHKQLNLLRDRRSGHGRPCTPRTNEAHSCLDGLRGR